MPYTLAETPQERRQRRREERKREHTQETRVRTERRKKQPKQVKEAGIKQAVMPAVTALPVTVPAALPEPETPLDTQAQPKPVIKKPVPPGQVKRIEEGKPPAPGMVQRYAAFSPVIYAEDIDPVTGLPMELLSFEESDETKPLTAEHIAAEKKAIPASQQIEKQVKQEQQKKVVNSGIGLLTLLTLLRGF